MNLRELGDTKELVLLMAKRGLIKFPSPEASARAETVALTNKFKSYPSYTEKAVKQRMRRNRKLTTPESDV